MIRINTPDIHGTIEYKNNGFIFSGRVINHKPVDDKLTYAAAAPAGRNSSFSGSGMPFASAAQAFDHTPNVGTVPVGPMGDFIVTLDNIPNAYYIGLGTTYVQPTIYFSWSTANQGVKNRSVTVSNGIPYRKLSYPWQRTNAEFYGGLWNLPVRSQEQILRDSAYKESAGESSRPPFWGLKPPV